MLLLIGSFLLLMVVGLEGMVGGHFGRNFNHGVSSC